MFLVLSIIFICNLYGQFSDINITIDNRLLRSDEKQELINLEGNIVSFFQNATWDDNYDDLNIKLYIQIIFQGVVQKGNEKIYSR